MRPAVSLAAALSVLGAFVGPSPADASVYLEKSEAHTRVLVIDPFSRPAMETLAQLNGAGAHIGNSATPVLSIDNILEHQNFEHPQYGKSFRVRRVLTFDLGSLLTQVNSAVDPYRKDGCSKFKISYPSLISLEAHTLRLRLDMSFKKRACGGWLGTHDIASGNGHAILVAHLRSAEGSPELTIETEHLDIDTDTVLGFNPDSMFGQIVRVLTVDLAKLMGALNPVRGTIGELQLKLLRPITRLAQAESISAAEAQYTSTEIADIVRGYGSLSDLLGNADAGNLRFTLADSGMARRAEYVLRPEFGGQKHPKLCSELGAGGLRDFYCRPSGQTKLVLRIEQSMIRTEDSRPFIEGHTRREAVYLSSLANDTVVKFYPSHTQWARIVDENYLDQKFGEFFRSNNADVRCARDLSPGRPRSTGEEFCAYRIVPAWRKL